MSDFLGADTEQLIGPGTRTETGGVALGELADSLHAVIHAAGWVGPDREALVERFAGEVRPLLDELAVRLGNGARDLYRHAAQQDLVSSIDGTLDSARYAALLEGEGWDDIIDWAQDTWEDSPFDDPLTIDDLGGRYLDTAEGQDFDPSSVDLSEEAIAAQTMRQGALGDCWLLAALMSTARTDPGFLARNITLTDAGTWEVTLYEDGQPVVVTVRPEELAADGARVDDDGSGNSWGNDPLGYMSIYEQAAINHLGPDYESVIASTPEAGIELVTGGDASSSDLLSWNGQPSVAELDQALAEGRPVTVMTDPLLPFNGELSAAHVYEVSGVDTATNEVILVNPWGDGASKPHEVRLPMDGFYENNIVMTGVGPRPEDFGPPAS